MASTGTLQGSNAQVLPLTSDQSGAADQGLFHVAIEPTPGVTGIIGPVSTTLDETKALLVVSNVSASSVVLPKYLRLHVYTIGTGGTRVHFTQAVDVINRYSAGGTVLTVNNTNSAVANSAAAQVVFGALTTAAGSGGRRFVGNTTFKASTIETVEDKYQLSWGGAGQLEDPASLSTTAAATSNIAYSFPSIEIGPGHSFVIHQWRASITVGITFGVEFGFIVK